MRTKSMVLAIVVGLLAGAAAHAEKPTRQMTPEQLGAYLSSASYDEADQAATFLADRDDGWPVLLKIAEGDNESASYHAMSGLDRAFPARQVIPPTARSELSKRLPPVVTRLLDKADDKNFKHAGLIGPLVRIARLSPESFTAWTPKLIKQLDNGVTYPTTLIVENVPTSAHFDAAPGLLTAMWSHPDSGVRGSAHRVCTRVRRWGELVALLDDPNPVIIGRIADMVPKEQLADPASPILKKMATLAATCPKVESRYAVLRHLSEATPASRQVLKDLLLASKTPEEANERAAYYRTQKADVEWIAQMLPKAGPVLQIGLLRALDAHPELKKAPGFPSQSVIDLMDSPDNHVADRATVLARNWSYAGMATKPKIDARPGSPNPKIAPVANWSSRIPPKVAHPAGTVASEPSSTGHAWIIWLASGLLWLMWIAVVVVDRRGFQATPREM